MWDAGVPALLDGLFRSLNNSVLLEGRSSLRLPTRPQSDLNEVSTRGHEKADRRSAGTAYGIHYPGAGVRGLEPEPLVLWPQGVIGDSGRPAKEQACPFAISANGLCASAELPPLQA
jgi:hypothetical protein